jgi:putative hemolysin
MRTAIELGILLLLVVVNGLFAMAETAIVAARKSRLEQRVGAGDSRARMALELSQHPNRFLATVQVGITMIGILAGAFGAATAAETLSATLASISWLAPCAQALGLGLVVLTITYLSLIFGELVPKRVALNNPEQIAARLAGAMRRLAAIASPAVWLLSVSTDAALRLLRVRQRAEPPVTAEEIGVLLEQGARAGEFEPAEREMVEAVFDLADEQVGMLMSPRPDIVWLDLEDPPEETRRRISESTHSRLPVCRGDLDEVVGVVRAKDLLGQYLHDQPLNLVACARPPLLVPESSDALRLLERFRQSGEHVALAVDEYEGVAGLIMHQDVLEAIVGRLPEAEEPQELRAVRRPDGSWLLDGTLPVDEVDELLGTEESLEEHAAGYRTLAGFVLACLTRIPVTGEGFEVGGWRFEVADMDGHRVDKVLVTPLAEHTPYGGAKR